MSFRRPLVYFVIDFFLAECFIYCFLYIRLVIGVVAGLSFEVSVSQTVICFDTCFWLVVCF